MKKLFLIFLFGLIGILYAQEYALISDAEEQMILVNKSGQDDTFRIKTHITEGSSVKGSAYSFEYNENNDERLATYATASLKDGETKRVPGEFDWSKINLVKIESKSGNKYTLNFYTKWDNLYVEILPYEDW